jgi:hypothetical protein
MILKLQADSITAVVTAAECRMIESGNTDDLEF